MSVFTIYCHGSGNHRSKEGHDLIAYMGRGARGVEYEDYLILDGPGGAPKDKNDKDRLAGTFD